MVVNGGYEIPRKAMWALYSHYVALGWLNGIALASVFGYCYYIQDAPANTCYALPGLMQLAWGFKFFLGSFQDAYPIFGFHRYYSITVGWAVCVAVSVVIVFFADSVSLIVYAALVAVAETAMVTADTAADALMVTYSKAEPDETRGSVMSICYACRFLAGTFSNAAVALLFNGYDEGGDFAFSLTLGQLWALAASVPAICLLTLLPHIYEPPNFHGARSLFSIWAEFYQVLKKPALYRVGVGMTCVVSLALVSNYAQTKANVTWFDYSVLQSGVDGTLSYALLAYTLHLLRKHCLGYNWRTMWIVAIVIMEVFELMYIALIWDKPYGVRNGWLFNFIDLDSQVAYDITFFLGIIMVPELVDPGLEGVTYAAFTTLTNCAENIASAISTQLLGAFKVGDDALEKDDTEVRWAMTKLQLITVAIALSSLLFVPMLPRQKDDCARLREGTESTLAAAAVLTIIFVGMAYGAAMNIFPLIPSTACYPVFGGDGCGDNDDV